MPIKPFDEWEVFEFPKYDLDAVGAIGRSFPPPLDGYVAVHTDHLGIGWVKSPHPGLFLALLAELEAQGREVRFYSVLNPRLARLLQLRDYMFNAQLEFSKVMGEPIGGWYKKPLLS